MIPKVALIGRPNVGKSTLFNRLTQSRNALVDSAPGLTRDLRYAKVTWNGLTMQIVDSGGIDRSPEQDQMSRIVHGQSLKAVAESDLLVIVVDVKEGLTPADSEVVNTARLYKKPYIIAVNKVDNVAREVYVSEFYELGVEEVVAISAEHGKGINDLMARVADMLGQVSLVNDHEGLDSLPPKERPIRVTLTGRPNTGKSSLLNRMLGKPRMIVTDVSGTTRDAIDTLLERPGKRDILFTDTAGIRRKAKIRDRVERFSIIKAMAAIDVCDIALVIMDFSEGITDQDKRLIGYTEKHGKACITLFNKWDLVQGDRSLMKWRYLDLQEAKRFIPYSPHLNISALTGKHVDRILPLVDDVYKDFSTLTTTGTVNRILQKATTKRTPPISKGHHLRVYYATQVATNPPRLLIFANYPDLIPNQYRRFLANQFRKELGLEQTPIRIVFRKKERRSWSKHHPDV
ncbi:MAG: ribosome biogenesis GTPase Der [Nitrospiraceae bacterium]|nr:ribosome biogenesis GTPase Der [Nitrospiraceae bacterium]